MGVAQEKGFYRLQKLKPEVLDVVRRMFIDQHKGHPMHSMLENWISLFEYPFELTERVNEIVGDDDATADFLDVSRSNTVEDMHMHFESLGSSHLDHLREGNITFFDDPDEALPFFIFICVQYFRTKAQRANFMEAVADYPHCDLTKAGDLISIILSTKLAHNLYVSGEYHLQLLENKTEVQFITGDQPVLNTYCYEQNPNDEPENLEFYYPVSPELAILLTESPSLSDPIKISVDLVNDYNSKVKTISHEQLYATSESQLLNLVSDETN
jgi:hypothetical protein